jgi:hypothetical protein
VLKYGSNGDLLWRTEHADTTPSYETILRDAHMDVGGRVWLAGSAGTICVDSAGVIVAGYPRSSHAVTADNEGRVFLAEVDTIRALSAAGVQLWTYRGYLGSANFLEPDGTGGVVHSRGDGFYGGTVRLDSSGTEIWHRPGMGEVFVHEQQVVVVSLAGDVRGFTLDGDSLYAASPLGGSGSSPAVAARGDLGVTYVAAEGDHWMVGPPYPHIGIAGVGSSGETAVRSSYIGPQVAYTPQAMKLGVDGGVFIVSDVHTEEMYRRPLVQRYDRLAVGVRENEDAGLPREFSLTQNYPNPFNPMTTIRYAVPQNRGQAVTVKVYDLLGRELANLADGPHAPGVYTARWNASAAASGVYFCRMTSGDFTATVKMLVVK